MKVLYFGDVFGKPGRDAVKIGIQMLVPEYQVDFVVINGENATHGRGITPEMSEEFFAAGVDVITTGNHAWDQKSLNAYFDTCPRIIRPANYPDLSFDPTPGHGTAIVENQRRDGARLAVLQVMGRVFMETLDCPFQVADQEVAHFHQMQEKCILVDFHGEATSEKQAFAHFMDGRVSAVVGSHSHVQTADERILPGGTAAITDVGMCGDFDSVIGIKKELSIRKFLTRRPVRYEPADGPGGYGAVIVNIDEETGLARSIDRFRVARAY